MDPMTSPLSAVPDQDLLCPRDGLSFVVGTTAKPLRSMTVSQLLDRTCERYGDRNAVIFDEQGVSLSWHELRERSDALAAALLSIGVRRGDRVGIWSPNRLEWLLTQFGTARIGAILVNINPAYRVSELEYALNKVGCQTLITARALRSSDYVAMLRTLAPELDAGGAGHPGELRSERLPHLRHLIVLGEGPVPARAFAFNDFFRRAGSVEREALGGLSTALDPDDPINIQFTSGTTGSPKGATLSHFNIVNNARFIARAMTLTEHDRLCIPVPLYHCFGMVLGVLACTSVGASMVFPGETFDAGSVLKAVHRHRCTGMHGVPTMFIAQLEHPEFSRYDLSSLRTGIMAGAPCPVETMRRVVSDMHLREITIAYGMTETSPVSFQSGADDPLERRVSTVGRIHPHLEVKIIDSQGRTVPVGQPGELCTRGYSVMRGYWEDAARTAEAIDEAGWMHTGDLATIDDQGYCNIVGRVKDMLIRGGENVYPREIEEFLYRHPAVQDVQVFGVPDARYGEEVCTWIVLRPGVAATADDIQAFCRGQIAHYKVPRHIRFVESFPLTATGKPQKYLMRDAMIAELGLQTGRTA
jgi:fatty-acyl-CoA synthase